MTNAIFLDLASILWLSDSLALRRSSPLLWRCCRFPLLRIFRRRRFPLLRIFRHRHLYRRLAMRLTLLLRQPATRPLARHQLHPEALHAPAGRLRLNQACNRRACSLHVLRLSVGNRADALGLLRVGWVTERPEGCQVPSSPPRPPMRPQFATGCTRVSKYPRIALPNAKATAEFKSLFEKVLIKSRDHFAKVVFQHWHCAASPARRWVNNERYPSRRAHRVLGASKRADIKMSNVFDGSKFR